MKIFIGSLLVLMLSLAVFGQKSKSPAPDFSATSMQGIRFDLDEMKGKVVLLTFWSTKCPICASEIPKLNELAENYRNKNVVFIGLTMENADKVAAYLKKKPFAFNIIPNSFDVVLKYGDQDGDGKVSMGFPAHFLINQKGEIALQTSGFDKTEILDAQLGKLLNSK